MSTPNPTRAEALKALIAGFLRLRLESKQSQLGADDPRRLELVAQFAPATWLQDAARRVHQIQMVTHSIKPLHPDARGSSLFREPLMLEPIQEVGSHSLGAAFETDVVGNAAALDVYKFLRLEHQGRSLLSLAAAADTDLSAALNADPVVAQAWMQDFAGLVQPRGMFRSHTLAKQIYWPVGSDPHDDASYHLLAPLYPTSLVHRVYQVLQDDRFGETATTARAARQTGAWSEHPVHEYPNLAIQKLGGTKPQNISQLNSERRGDNCLLASVPPVWLPTSTQPVLGVSSLFAVFGRRREVRSLVKDMRRLRGHDPASNLAMRARRNEVAEALLDELMQFTAEMHTLAPGWSDDPGCDLPSHHAAWLDPEGPHTPTEATAVPDRIAADFAHWLNGQLRDPLPRGDAEYRHWQQQARGLLNEAERMSAL
jgi:CRISPR-associated protein Csy1